MAYISKPPRRREQRHHLDPPALLRRPPPVLRIDEQQAAQPDAEQAAEADGLEGATAKERHFISMWNSGESWQAIAHQMGWQGRQTVYNFARDLREIYGEHWVPRRRKSNSEYIKSNSE
jgi:hypothetical protein